MNKQQFQKVLECHLSRCKYLNRCKVYWGKRCREQGGKKIPRMKKVGYYGMNEVGRLVAYAEP